MKIEIKLYNSLSRKVEIFHPIESNTVRMYSCGPTVYNYAHIGNMRAFLFADLLQRVLRTVGKYNVKWVMNITNIDDKTLKGSALGSSDWLEAMGIQKDDPWYNLRKFTEFYTDAFLEDITKLGIELNHFYAMPKATDYIIDMQELILKILENNFAYISEGSIYFNLKEWMKEHQYGRLFQIDFDNFIAGARIDSDQYEKEQANDFALWKAKKEGEIYWDFEINGINYPGRPGWHIECSVMEAKLLGLPFDIHTGGVDLKFPHHEDEIAQSHSGYGIDPTIFWCHNEFLEVEGQKMSKSLGNFFTLRDLLNKNIDPLDIRYAMLSAHYGSKYNFTFAGIEAARKARFRIQDYIHSLFDLDNFGSKEQNIEELSYNIFNELANDLHTPKALANLFSFINNNPTQELNKITKDKLIELFFELNSIFNIWKIEPSNEELIIPEKIKELAEKRLLAKKDKNWHLADKIRNEIISQGYKIKDTKDSYIIERD
mgnify:CR=1 FL=1